MVRVASCPKCSHEAVMFDKTDSEDWVRCPECRTYFQIKNAAARDIPQLVMTQDEALLAEEESETGKETVCSALETRWDNRRTLHSTSQQTIAEFEAPAMSAEQNEEEVAGRGGQNGDLAPETPGNEPIEADEPPRPSASTGDEPAATAADPSPVDDWSELPFDEAEAQARAEQAGETPDDSPATSETPTLRLHRSHSAKVGADLAKKSSESSDDSDDRFDKWFQTKKTIVDFDPPTPDELELEIADPPDEHPGSDAPAAVEADEMLDDFVDVDAPVEDEPEIGDTSGSRERFDSAAPEDDRTTDGAWSPPNLEGRAAQTWARPGRKRSTLRMLIMSGVGAVFGLVLGYYALLWLTGPSGDFLEVAKYLPSAMLPADFQSPRSRLAANQMKAGDAPAADDAPSSLAEPVDAKPLAQPLEGNEQSVAAAAEESNAVEPAQFEETAATPAASSDEREVAAVSNAPSFTADELAVALRTAQQAQPNLVAGDLSSPLEVKRTKAKSYALLCDLAQKASFVDAASRAEYVAPLMNETSELFRTTLADAKTRGEVAQIVPMWIKSPNRQHGGIFFAGQVAREVRQGPVVEWQIDLGHESIPVLVDPTKAETVESPARPLAIVGWIVDKPAELVTGYTGQAPQAIWAAHIIPLE